MKPYPLTWMMEVAIVAQTARSLFLSPTQLVPSMCSGRLVCSPPHSLLMMTESSAQQSERNRLKDRRRSRVNISSSKEPTLGSNMQPNVLQPSAPQADIRSENGSSRGAGRQRERERVIDSLYKPMGVNVELQDETWRHSVFEFKSINDPAHRRNEATPRRSRASGTQVEDTSQHFEVKYAEPQSLPISSGEDMSWFKMCERRDLAPSEKRTTVSELGRPAKVLMSMLGIKKDCSFEELRSKYRAEVKICHPDMVAVRTKGGTSEVLLVRFRLLSTAWKELKEHPKFSLLIDQAPPEKARGSASPTAIPPRKPITLQRRQKRPSHVNIEYESDCDDVAGSSC
ncbi:unnamed protein product [Choristocarpus tenellus]